MSIPNDFNLQNSQKVIAISLSIAEVEENIRIKISETDTRH